MWSHSSCPYGKYPPECHRAQYLDPLPSPFTSNHLSSPLKTRYPHESLHIWQVLMPGWMPIMWSWIYQKMLFIHVKSKLRQDLIILSFHPHKNPRTLLHLTTACHLHPRTSLVTFMLYTIQFQSSFIVINSKTTITNFLKKFCCKAVLKNTVIIVHNSV